MKFKLPVFLCGFSLLLSISLNAAPVRGWLNWRGPDQNGVSPAKQALPTEFTLRRAGNGWVVDSIK